jgi:hypothetical protein
VQRKHECRWRRLVESTARELEQARGEIGELRAAKETAERKLAAALTDLEGVEEPGGEHLYRDVPTWSSAPSAGAEFGIGTVIPSLRTPAEQLTARLGVAIQTPSNWTFILAGRSGNSSPYYGYLVRVPFQPYVEAVCSQLVDYRGRRYLNFHFGLSGGPEFLLSAQCQSGNCGYVTPGSYWGLGVRAGLSYSAQVRSSIGLFVTLQNDFPSCATGSHCDYVWLSTLTWSLGWTLF